MTTQSITVTLVAGTENHAAVWVPWYSTIVVENGASAAVIVRMDGTAATATGTGEEEVPQNSTGAFGNPQPEPDIVTGSSGLYPSGYGTYVSLISTGAGAVTVSVQ